MRDRLASSFAHVLDAALPHLSIDPAPVWDGFGRLRAASRSAFARDCDAVRGFNQEIPLARRILEQPEASMATLSPPFTPTCRPQGRGPAVSFQINRGAAASQGL